MPKRRRRLLQHDWNSRVTDKKTYGKNYEAIFGKPTPKKARSGRIVIKSRTTPA